MLPSYQGKRALITGGAGFIGSTLAIRLVELGAHVTLVDSELPDTGANLFNIAPIAHCVRYVHADIADREVIGSLVEDVDVVFNLAGTLSHIDSMRAPARDLHANCTAHVELLEQLRIRNPDARILYAGTRGQYGPPRRLPVAEDHPLEPVDANGINKAAGEAYHLLYGRHYGMFTCSLRLSNAYGARHQMRHPRQGVLNWFVRRVLDGDPIIVYGDGTQIRDTHHVDDVVEAMLLAVASDRARGQVYNLGASPLSLNLVAEIIIRLHGAGSVEHRRYPEDARGVEVGDYVADCTKIQTELGWVPEVPPDQGFARTLEYYREHKPYYW